MRGIETTEGGSLMTGLEPVVIAAHELKSPLVLLRQLALDLQSQQLSQSEQERVLAQMQHISDKALRLTSDITAVSHVQDQLFSLSPVNPLDVANDIENEMRLLYATHGRALRLGRIRRIPPVVANRDLLRRILLNFADNALHYGDANGVVELHAQLVQERHSVRLSVRDYGPAMSKQHWKQLVTSLRDVKPMQSRPQSSGLGIYISHQFAQAMNGTIGATRHRNGASFYVELPVSNQLTLL